jgi:hypothetical protein
MAGAPSLRAQQALLDAVQREHPGARLRIVDAHGFTLGRVEREAHPRWFFVGYCDDLMLRYGIPFGDAA